jgi:carbon-monoxide dehydrogenase small subunit
MSIELKVNGEPVTFQGAALTSLIDVLRNDLLLTGSKAMCREGFCGACTVHVDGMPMKSCLVPIGLAAGKEVVTIEGLSAGETLSPLQQVLEAHDVVQCGMCFSGMVMTLTVFLAEKPEATAAEIKAALAGNICRCTGYERLIAAVLSLKRGGSTT